MIVHLSSRMRDFFFPDELMYPDGVNQCTFHLLCACHHFPANNHWEWDLDQIRLETGIWYTPLQDRLIILLLSYLSTRNVVQIAQLLNNSDTLF